MASKTVSGKSKTAIDADFPPGPQRREISERSERLKTAVRAAGGNQAVADRAQMHVGTLNRYLGGRDMKASAMITLAEACNVSLIWLATGRGTMLPTDQPAAGPAGPRFLKMFGAANMDTLAEAMEVATLAFQAKGFRPPWRRMAQVVALIYDTLTEPDGDPDQVQRALSEADVTNKNT